MWLKLPSTMWWAPCDETRWHNGPEKGPVPTNSSPLVHCKNVNTPASLRQSVYISCGERKDAAQRNKVLMPHMRHWPLGHQTWLEKHTSPRAAPFHNAHSHLIQKQLWPPWSSSVASTVPLCISLRLLAFWILSTLHVMTNDLHRNVHHGPPTLSPLRHWDQFYSLLMLSRACFLLYFNSW